MTVVCTYYATCLGTVNIHKTPSKYRTNSIWTIPVESVRVRNPNGTGAHGRSIGLILDSHCQINIFKAINVNYRCEWHQRRSLNLEPVPHCRLICMVQFPSTWPRWWLLQIMHIKRGLHLSCHETKLHNLCNCMKKQAMLARRALESICGT